MPGAGQRCRVAPRLPHTPWVLAGSVSKVFQRFFYYWKKERKKKYKNTRKPKSDLVQALEHLWHWTLRKSSCASGRNLHSGRQGLGSAGPRSHLLGWAPARAAGGQSCVSGHPVGSGDRRGQQVRGHPGATIPLPCVPTHTCTFSRWLWPLGPGPRPRSPSPELSGEELTAWEK